MHRSSAVDLATSESDTTEDDSAGVVFYACFLTMAASQGAVSPLFYEARSQAVLPLRVVSRAVLTN